MKRKQARFTVVVFLVLLFGLSLANALKKDTIFSENENRYLAGKPEWSVARFFDGVFGQEFETYLTDQFLGRDAWVSVKTLAELAMGKRESNHVFFAKDGYLIERHDASELASSYYEKNCSYLSQFIAAQTEKLGMGRVQVLLAPAASQVLTEKLPAYAPGWASRELSDHLRPLLPEGTLVDVQPVLAEAQDSYIYYRTDHHWTTLGAYYAYRVWMNARGETPWQLDDFQAEPLSHTFLGTVYSKANYPFAEPDTMYRYCPVREDIRVTVTYNQEEEVTYSSLYMEEYLSQKDQYPVYLNGNQALTRIRTNVEEERKLLIIKDSYANSFTPFAVNHFQEVQMIDLRYFNGSLSAYIQGEGITDLLFLYGGPQFIEDRNLGKLLR
ncbi:DHHW family protein [Bianquea renquensis]|uniref:AlgX/AlgJ SGNH hydrolase-like domain-containing protein n=1 Tax=Bianquea renquensis TaxID=2763661 RepID=A0A926DUB1_9FIRM|nr:DHHW family protein [Bianquea renquensis]MBC8544078.1 hypothetical protein [Bianquea renquensis]